jgi:hypothetical protein
MSNQDVYEALKQNREYVKAQIELLEQDYFKANKNDKGWISYLLVTMQLWQKDLLFVTNSLENINP